MKYLHLYNSQTDYDNKKNTLILPSASLIEENNHVEYNPHHDFVEIAGIKWATMNVGAKSITDYGLYFQWGDTQGYTKDEIEKEHKKAFVDNFSDYNIDLMTKYNSNGMTLELEDDAVNAAWGGSWRMPTVGDFQKLCDAVNTEWKTNYQGSGVNGLLCSTKTEPSKTLFFPACGDVTNGTFYAENEIGFYWLNSLSTDNLSYACALDLSSKSTTNWFKYIRCDGFTVRGVLDD